MLTKMFVAVVAKAKGLYPSQYRAIGLAISEECPRNVLGFVYLGLLYLAL